MQRWRNMMCGTLAGLLLVASPAAADLTIEELGSVLDKFTLGMDINTFYRYDSNPYFGAPIGGAHESAKTEAAWGELFAVFRLTAEKDFGWAKTSAQFAPYYTQTIDTDAYGIAKDQGDLQVDQAWIRFGEIKGGPFSLTVGRQDVRLENWLIIADGEGQDQAVWLNFHDSFPFAVRLDGDFGKFSSTLFWARADNYVQKWDETFMLGGGKDDVEVAGLNLHYDISEGNHVFAGVYRKFEDGNTVIDYSGLYLDGIVEAENNTLAYDLGAHLTLGGLVFEIEGVLQKGDAGTLNGSKRDRDAFGGFTSLTYNLPVAYAPYLRGSYFYFSGDDKPGDDEASDFDPMFSGFSAWNRFVIGEVTGELHLPNSNKKTALLEVGFSPLENVFVSLHYLQHKLDEKYWLFVPTTSDDWADEVNLFVDVPVNDNLFVHFGTGIAMPGKAAEEIMGDDKNNLFAQVWMKYSF
ncbi:MAG: alginate export family protein [Desulfuromonadales bacterium]|nr:alginate export family protein [Desulfuromonadales bacterium]